MDKIPITKANQLDNLDNDEVIQGYWDGKDNEPEPGDNRSYLYWHGYRNGQVDGGYAKSDEAQKALAYDVVKTGYLKKLYSAETKLWQNIQKPK